MRGILSRADAAKAALRQAPRALLGGYPERLPSIKEVEMREASDSRTGPRVAEDWSRLFTERLNAGDLDGSSRCTSRMPALSRPRVARRWSDTTGFVRWSPG